MENILEERIPTWEILAAIVGYFTSVEPAIYLVGHHILGQKKDEISTCLRIEVASVYAILFLVVGAWTLYKFGDSKKDPSHGLSPTDRAVQVMKRHQLLRILRSFGLVIIYEWLLDRMGVQLYGGFNRYADWTPRPELFDYIDRYSLDNESVEFQYSRDCRGRF